MSNCAGLKATQLSGASARFKGVDVDILMTTDPEELSSAPTEIPMLTIFSCALRDD